MTDALTQTLSEHLPAQHSDEALAAAAQAQGLAVMALSHGQVHQPRSNGLLMGFSDFTSAKAAAAAVQHLEHVKVRYRALKKNTAQIVTLFALSNLWMMRHNLLAMGQVHAQGA